MPFIHKFMPIYEAIQRWIVSTSDSKEDGCTVIAVVFTRSIPNPKSTHLRQFRYCGASPRECLSLCPLPSSEESPQSPSDNRLWPAKANAAFPIFIKISSEGTTQEHTGVESVCQSRLVTFLFRPVGIYLAVCGNVVFHPHELNDALNRIDEYCLEGIHFQLVAQRYRALVTGNSKGLAVADIATESDIDVLTSFGDVVVMEGGVNTAEIYCFVISTGT